MIWLLSGYPGTAINGISMFALKCSRNINTVQQQQYDNHHHYTGQSALASTPSFTAHMR